MGACVAIGRAWCCQSLSGNRTLPSKAPSGPSKSCTGDDPESRALGFRGLGGLGFKGFAV